MKLFSFVSVALSVFFLGYFTWAYSPTREDVGIATLIWFGISVTLIMVIAIVISTEPSHSREWNEEKRAYESIPKSWDALHSVAHFCLIALIPLYLFFGFLYAKHHFDIPSIEVNKTSQTYKEGS